MFLRALQIHRFLSREVYTRDYPVTETEQMTVRLEPGKTYEVSVYGDELYELDLQALAPPGYFVEIDGVRRNWIHLEDYSNYLDTSVQLRVRAPIQEYSGRAGTATALTSGRVFWQAALGYLANGKPAGSLAIIDVGSGTWDSLFTPAALWYEATSSEVEVVPTPGGAQSPFIPGAIRQVLVPQAVVDVVPTSTTEYGLKFYHPGQASGSAGSVRTFTGEPFAWYTISKDGSVSNRMVIQCDLRNLPDLTSTGLSVAVSKKTVLERTGTAPDFTWTADEWYDTSASSLSRDVRSRSSGVETVTVATPGGSTVSQVSRTYSTVPWGEEVTSETNGTGGNAATTTSTYYTSDAQAGSYGQINSKLTTGGDWEAYQYYASTAGSSVAGALYKLHRPFKNSDTTVPADLSTHTGEVTTFQYTYDAFGRKTRPTLVETKVNGVVTSRTTTSYSTASAGITGHSALYLVTATRNGSSADGVSLTTVTKYFRENSGVDPNHATDDFYRNRTHSVQSPDGRKTSYAYQRGTWNGSSFTLSGNGGADAGPASRISVIHGNATTGSSYPTHEGYNIEDLYLVDGKSTMEVTIRDSRALVVRTETHVWKNSTWNLVSHVDLEHTYAGQIKKRTASNGAIYEAAYTGDRLTSETNEQGVTVTYTHDAAGRVQNRTRTASGAIGAVTTRFTYDGAGRVTQEVAGYGQSENLTTTRAYDTAGRVTSEDPPGLGATTYSYDPANRTRTTTFPDGSTRIDSTFADGQIASVTGTGVVAEHYDCAIQTGGVRYSIAKVGSTGSTRIRESWSDWLGRVTKTSKPGWTGQPAVVEEKFFSTTTGQLTKSTVTGYAPTLYEYGSMGELVRSGLDVNDDGLVLASSDRISEGKQFFEHDGTHWWLRSESKIYPYINSSTVLTTSFTRTRLTGHPSGTLEETRTTDGEGNVATRTVAVNRSTRTTTITTTHAGVGNSQVEKLINGLSTEVTTTDGLTFTTQYDSLLRASSVTDPRIGATTTAYQSGTALVASVTDATSTQVSAFTYDTSGRVTLQSNAASHKTRFAYNLRGQLTHQWGDGAYPVSYTYDTTTGERTGMSTYRDLSATDSTTWPTGGTADTTTFTYDAATGFLWKKTDAASKVIEFSYNERGQSYQRFWARTTTGGSRVTATYAYDSATGELTGISYNDGTPSVSTTYNRLGQTATVTDGPTGQRTFNYDNANNRPWRHTDTQLPAFYGSRVMTRLYDSSGVVGRYKGFQVGSSGDRDQDLEQIYGFTSATGRFETLQSKRSNGTVSRTFQYGYLANSGLVSTLSITGHDFTVTRAYESNRNLLTSIDSKWSTTSVTRYDFVSNSLYQRESAKQSGTAFADYGDSTFYKYTYNARGELTEAKAYLGSTVSATSNPLPGRQFSFGFDSIGNRQWADRTGDSAEREDYTTNNLNQYTTKENHAIPVQGTVDAGSTTVAVSGSTSTAAADRQARFWAFEATVSNASAPWSGTLNVHAAQVGGGTGGADLIRTEPRTARIAAALQTFTYDLDGNLTSDGVWDYTYDAENRLLRMQTTTAAANAGLPNRLIDFKYDYLGRRVEKKIADYSGSTWVFQSQRRYLYDGWNLVAEFTSTTEGTLGTLLRSYTWGLDVAGSFSATGGVGALLQIHDYSATKTLLATYDGNGNVAALLNDGTGTPEAVYEYSPFGELLRSEGTYAAENPFRFSTKYRDDETGLVYYGHRYYSPTLGRFINRDPIAEAGGINLYGFALNNPVTARDVLGMYPDDDWSDYDVEEVYSERHYRGNWGYSRTRYWGTHKITGDRTLLHTETEYYDDEGDYFDEEPLNTGTGLEEWNDTIMAYEDEARRQAESGGGLRWTAPSGRDYTIHRDGTWVRHTGGGDVAFNVNGSTITATYATTDGSSTSLNTATYDLTSYAIHTEVANGPRLAAAEGATGLGGGAIPKARSRTTGQGQFVRIGTVVDRVELGTVNPGGGRFLQYTDASQTIDSGGIYGKVSTIRAIALYGFYTTEIVQWSGYYINEATGAVRVHPEARFYEHTLISTERRASMKRFGNGMLATRVDMHVSNPVLPQHRVGYKTVSDFKRLDD